ncbi:MAG TPA: hypothetical protein VH988_26205 [Thermoanaerobaculia bacterium]|jgi:hypothetical protein|nr:hypothetical protein [Thermoanaerobaculia bacterium]
MSADIQLVAVPPVVDPEDFHDFEGFRETTLSLFTDPEHNAALRATGRLLFTMASEGDNDWPAEPEGSPRHQLRAAVADLRFMQGFLGMLGRPMECARAGHDGHLARVALRLSGQVGEIAAVLESELGNWRGEE